MICSVEIAIKGTSSLLTGVSSLSKGKTSDSPAFVMAVAGRDLS